MKRDQNISHKGNLPKVALTIILFLSIFSFSGNASNASPQYQSENTVLVISNRYHSKRTVSYTHCEIRFDKNKIFEKREMVQRQFVFDKLVLTQLRCTSRQRLSLDVIIKFFQLKTLPTTGSEDYIQSPRG